MENAMFTFITPRHAYRVNAPGKNEDQVRKLAEESGFTVLSVFKDGSRYKGAKK